MKKLLLSGFALIAFAAISFGQATATATGTVIAATGITNQSDMNFANVATGPSGTIILTASTGQKTTTGGVIVSGTHAFATFALVGGATQSYNFTIPTATVATVINPSGATAMTVDGWNSVPQAVSGAGSGVLTGGTGTITLGATLHVGANQTVGTYTTGSFPVTVNFQ